MLTSANLNDGEQRWWMIQRFIKSSYVAIKLLDFIMSKKPQFVTSSPLRDMQEIIKTKRETGKTTCGSQTLHSQIVSTTMRLWLKWMVCVCVCANHYSVYRGGAAALSADILKKKNFQQRGSAQSAGFVWKWKSGSQNKHTHTRLCVYTREDLDLHNALTFSLLLRKQGPNKVSSLSRSEAQISPNKGGRIPKVHLAKGVCVIIR